MHDPLSRFTTLTLAAIGATILSGHTAGAQDTRDVLVRLHRAGDTVSIRGATVTIDHTIEAGTTDSGGIVRIPDLLDGGHIIEVVARGYQAYFDNFTTGASVRQPIQLELLPIPASDTARAKGQVTPLTFAGFNARRSKGQGKFFTLDPQRAPLARCKCTKAPGRIRAPLFIPGYFDAAARRWISDAIVFTRAESLASFA